MSKTKATCPYCGAVDTIEGHEVKVKGKREKVKFTGGWVVASIFTGGLAIIAFFIERAADRFRRKPTIGVNRWNECSACKTAW